MLKTNSRNVCGILKEFFSIDAGTEISEKNRCEGL